MVVSIVVLNFACGSSGCVLRLWLCVVLRLLLWLWLCAVLRLCLCL